MVRRLPKHGRVFVWLATCVERAFRTFDNRHVRTFMGARTIPFLAGRVGGHRAYADWCFHAGVYAGLLASLERPRLRVLDVGCGAGEIVAGLLQGMSRDSVYLGLDIDPRMIRQCREAVTDPCAQFSLVSGASPFYALGNTDEGRDLSEVCGENQWDVIIAKALFDHLSPKDLETHLHLFSRGIVGDGLIIATFFLLEDEFWTNVKAVERRYHFAETYAGQPGFRYSAAHHPLPEAQLAIESSYLTQLLGAASLRIARVMPGTWRDPQGRTGLDMPDTLVLTRRR